MIMMISNAPSAAAAYPVAHPAVGASAPAGAPGDQGVHGGCAAPAQRLLPGALCHLHQRGP